MHEPKWRFTSLPELMRIVRASALLAVSLLTLDYVLLSPAFYGDFFFGKITIAIYFVIQLAFLAATRIAYRYFREVRTQRHARDENSQPILILGRAADVEVPLRAIESGAITRIWPAGLLSPAPPIRA
jgi:FlaA1/EpsC-like NDP-sugar epimerase